MKKGFLILLSISLMHSCVSKNETSTFTKEQAHELVDQFYNALSRGDSLLLKRVLAEDFTMYEHEVQWNIDSLLALMPLTQGRIWRIDEVNFKTRADIAHIYYYNESDRPKGRSWYESMLIVKENEWKIQFMHSTKRYLNEKSPDQ